MSRKKEKVDGFFSQEEIWREAWRGMPEYEQTDLQSARQIQIHFRNNADVIQFAKLLKQNIGPKTKYLWYPAYKERFCGDKEYVIADGEEPVNPQYPVYIISKGRWRQRLTSRMLERMGVPYYIVVEPQEYAHYASVIDQQKILVLPFSNLGQGSIPARNWVWEHALVTGAKWHWILDDNILSIFRRNYNFRITVCTGAVFRAAEDFVDRYENIAQAGFQYRHFSSDKTLWNPFVINCRVYSCMLIRNDLPYRWRGRYNEDTDLSIRMLKDNWCTVLFYAFIQQKAVTMTMKGGNTDELYAGDGRLGMAESLREQHPDIAQVGRRWNRYQHVVDYSFFRRPWRNKLRLKSGIIIPNGVNNYGMVLRIRDTKEVIDTEILASVEH